MGQTENIQQKLKDLGYLNEVNGIIGFVSNSSDPTRVAIKKFKSSLQMGSDSYINADFLKKLDATHKNFFPTKTIPATYFKGWNTDLKIGVTPEQQAIIQPKPTPTKPDVISNPVKPASGGILVIDETKPNNKNMIIYAGGVVVAIALFVMSQGKKKRK